MNVMRKTVLLLVVVSSEWQLTGENLAGMIVRCVCHIRNFN